jgi:hypothetical protein
MSGDCAESYELTAGNCSSEDRGLMNPVCGWFKSYRCLLPILHSGRTDLVWASLVSTLRFLKARCVHQRLLPVELNIWPKCAIRLRGSKREDAIRVSA